MFSKPLAPFTHYSFEVFVSVSEKETAKLLIAQNFRNL